MKNDDEVENISALVEDAKDNPIAFGRLYDIYVQPVYRYLYSRVGTTHDAEDLTSQTFMSAFEFLPRYRENGQFAAWLFRIARSKMMDHFRGNRYEVEVDVAEKFGSGGDALIQVIQDEEIVQLCRDMYPKGDVKVTIWELSVLKENAWQAEWKP